MFQRQIRKPLAFQKSFFLLGARGSGKTDWLKRCLPNALYFDFLMAKWRTLFLASPEQLEQYIPKGFDDWIILDEVQKVPDILNEVHRLIETYGYRFILTGSSARKLKQKSVNLLAGRARTYHLHPLIASELEDDFDAKKYLTVGGLPEAYLADDPEKFLQSYVFTYLQEEILQESLLRNLESFTRFLQSASLSQGNILNLSAIARDASLKQKTVTQYFSLLEDLLLSFQLPAFTKRAKRRLTQHPKFYLFDVGVYRAIRPRGILDTPEEIDGAALETAFLQHLRAINDYFDLGYQLSYWRTSNGHEVDCIVYGEKGFFAFEIKRSAHPHNMDLKGLKTFQKDYPEAQCFVVYGGQEHFQRDEITFIPFVDCLPQLESYLNV